MSDSMPISETASSEEFIFSFNLVRMLQYLSKNGFVVTAIIAVISYRLSDLSLEIYNNLVFPFLNVTIDKKDGNDIKLEDFTTNIGGTNIKTGKLVLGILKFIIIIYMVFLVGFIVEYVK